MSNKKNVMLVAPYVTFPDEPGANRFITIANMLSEKYEVTLVTSSYCHILKQQRTTTPSIDSCRVVLLKEPGYSKNVSVKRFMSHKVFTKNFKKFLNKNAHHFDVIYSAYPLIYTNYLLGRYKEKLKYKLIIDVQDIWPDSITGPIPALSNSLGRALLYPINKYADKTYSYADGLIAVSETYLKVADVSNLPDKYKKVVYIGADNILDANHYRPTTDKEKPLVAAYIGTMAGSYDLKTVIEAANLCKNKIQFYFIGAGEDEYNLKQLNYKLGNNVSFLGTLPYNEAMNILSQADIAINPIKASSQASMTNKLSDYLSLGLPIISCQKNSEIVNLLEHQGNFQYEAGDAKSLANKLLYIESNRSVLKEISENNFLFAQKQLSRHNSYIEIANLIEAVIK